jgi:endonuclease/exonuclease/phosphatase family metal-dependent hydrolase
LNCRRSDLIELRSARKWINRRGQLMQVIKAVDPSVMGLQECTKEQAEYIEAQLGADQWAYFGAHNVRVFVNITKWRLLNWWGFDLDAGTLQPARHLVACHLQSISTGDTALFCATHLTPHDTSYARTWRVKQMHQIGLILPTLPDWDKTILMGDINDTSLAGGVRGAAGEFGLKGLRARNPEETYHFNLNTFNAWGITPANGVWIDEVFTGPAAKPYHAGVERTDTKRPLDRNATDHNGIRASVEFTGGPVV